MPFVVESTGEENANLYKRGVNEGSRGGSLDASELLELLDVFRRGGVDGGLLGAWVAGLPRPEPGPTA